MRKVLALVILSLCLNFGLALAEKPLNLNAVTIEELKTLPGITDEIAQKILAFRQQMGDFQQVDELLEAGVSPEQFAAWKDLIVVEALEGADCGC